MFEELAWRRATLNMHLESLKISIAESLPEKLLRSDVGNVLSSAHYQVHLDAGTLDVPEDYEIEVLSRSFQDPVCAGGFTALSALIAIREAHSGSGEPRGNLICYATLHYDEHLKLVTSDFGCELL